MKRRDLVKALEDMGCILIRHGGRHDWFTNQQTKQSQPVLRHNEINDNLAKSIIKTKLALGYTATEHLSPRTAELYLCK